jgi:SAM-dependent methyltransferase
MLLSSYGRVASEYYDIRRHPTCANFRQASRLLLELLVPETLAARSCEVGAGDSLLAELLWRRHGSLDGLLITDAQPEMLEHSRGWERCGAKLSVAAANSIPVSDESLDLVVASLADPYDDDSFWEEVSRVLTRWGKCVVTTPSATWAHRFRADESPDDAAEFELADRSKIYVASLVRSPEEERVLIENQDLDVIREASATLKALDEPISPKLRVLGPDDAVVCGVVAARSSNADYGEGGAIAHSTSDNG